FFQAEDGIRYDLVTGVQTCALPISAVSAGASATITVSISAVNGFTGTVTLTDNIAPGLTCSAIAPSNVLSSGTATVSCNSLSPRSEERRVGKECRSGWTMNQEKNTR